MLHLVRVDWGDRSDTRTPDPINPIANILLLSTQMPHPLRADWGDRVDSGDLALIWMTALIREPRTLLTLLRHVTYCLPKCYIRFALIGVAALLGWPRADWDDCPGTRILNPITILRHASYSLPKCYIRFALIGVAALIGLTSR
jgi:hypothetical protein